MPLEQELGTLQTTLNAVAKRLSKNSRRSLKEFPRSLATERIKRARHEERARDPDTRPDREVVEGTGPSSAHVGDGNGPPSRSAESSVNDTRIPRESVVKERETKRVRINGFDAKKAMNGWRQKKNGFEPTVVPDEICSFRATLSADLS